MKVADFPFKPGNTYTANYTGSPVPPERQYSIGQVVQVTEAGTGKVLGYFRVAESTYWTVSGPVIPLEQGQREWDE